MVNKAVAFHNNSVSIKTPKTKAGNRTVPIPKKIVPLLQKAKDGADSEYVCPSVKGEIMIYMLEAWLHHISSFLPPCIPGDAE